MNGPTYGHDTQDDDGQHEYRKDGDEHDVTLGGVTASRNSVSMTTLLPPSPANVVDALRGDRAVRPIANTTSAAGLRAQLEDGIYTIMGKQNPSAPLVIRASSFRHVPPVTDASPSALGRIRGVLITQLLRLHCVGEDIDHAFDEAVDAWRGDVGTNDLVGRLEQMDDDERARLATDVTAHCVTMTRALGSLPSRWMPRSAVRASQRLAAGNVVLRDVVDLMIGTNVAGRSSVVLLDVTTSPLAENAERTMRYHALVETLRTSIAPLRTSAFSTATGELWASDVDHELLARSADEVLEVINELWKGQ
jgi:hypothetical protein